MQINLQKGIKYNLTKITASYYFMSFKIRFLFVVSEVKQQILQFSRIFILPIFYTLNNLQFFFYL